jgi:hypothetical protein
VLLPPLGPTHTLSHANSASSSPQRAIVCVLLSMLRAAQHPPRGERVRVWRAATSKARPKADVRLDLRVGRVHSLGEESEAQHGPVFTQVAVLRHDAIPVLLLCHVTRAVLRLQPLPLFTPRLA